MKKLVDIFPSYYHCQKVEESACLESSLPDSGATNLGIVKKAFRKFRDAVKQADKETYEGLEHDYELVEYAIACLEEFFQARKRDDEAKTHRAGACIFSYFLHDRFRALERLAQEIDKRHQG